MLTLRRQFLDCQVLCPALRIDIEHTPPGLDGRRGLPTARRFWIGRTVKEDWKMQTHLTRRVFRAIVNNEPLQSARCRHCLPQTVRRPGLSSFNHVQRRGLLSFDAAATTPGEQRASTLPSETGLKTMRDLERALADKSRGPTNGILAKAFQEFFAARAENPGFITGFQAHLLSDVESLADTRGQAGAGRLDGRVLRGESRESAICAV